MIKLIFYKGDDLLSKFIKKVTRGEVSHCGFLLDNLIVADTDLFRNFGLRFIPWNKKDFIIIDIKITKKQELELIDWIYEHINTKYDFWENVKYLFYQVSHKNDEAMMNCAESVIEGLCSINYLHPAFENENLSPQEVFDLIKNRN